MSDLQDKFVQEFVLLFGFLEGIWLRVGISPDEAILNALVEALKEINPDYSWLAILIVISSIIFLIITILQALDIGGFLGIFAILLAFIAGILLLNQISIILLIFAIIIGYIAPNTT